MNRINVFLISTLLVLLRGCAWYNKKGVSSEVSKIEEQEVVVQQQVEGKDVIPPPVSEKTNIDTVKTEETPQTTEDIKAKFLSGESLAGFNKKDVLKLFGEPYTVYLSDTDTMEIWFYKDFYVGFNVKDIAVKVSSDKREYRQILQQYIDKQET